MDKYRDKEGPTGIFTPNNNDSYVYSNLTTLNINVSSATEADKGFSIQKTVSLSKEQEAIVKAVDRKIHTA